MSSHVENESLEMRETRVSRLGDAENCCSIEVDHVWTILIFDDVEESEESAVSWR